jgi:cytoskeleton protein RodZ
MDEKKDIPVEGGTPPPPQETVQDLKSVREARGLSLHNVYEITRVSLVNLTAVECGDFNHLPPPVYARNFIRKYARAVGIDEKPILDRYEKHLERLKPPKEEITVQKPWPAANRRYVFLFMSLAAVIVSGILVSAIFLYDQVGQPPSPAPAVVVESPPTPVASTPENTEAIPASPAPETTSETTMKSATPPVTPEKTILPPVSTAGKLYHLVLDARELTWIRITEDQNPAYQVLLKPGERIERMASDFFQLDIGNAGGINLTFQGKPLGSLGKQGQIIHMRLPEKGSERKSP